MLAYLRDMASRPSPRDLRASDADRERVLTLLGEAAADGRLTLDEHSERAERAYAARTLGDLAGLTTDLAGPSAQPIQLDSHRAVTGLFRRESREGHWVVPDRLAASAICGEVTLDLRQALLQSSRIVVMATVILGTLRLIVPEEVAVEITGTGPLGRSTADAGPGAGSGIARSGPSRRPEQPVVEVRAFSLGGRVKVIRPRRSRWPRPRLRRPGRQFQP
jgi:Domain of unknown function (DUF1707)/Cell wall-active antibiotics response 4TMS YvqF